MSWNCDECITTLDRHELNVPPRRQPFPDRLAWLSADLKQRARGLALTIWQRGVEDLDHAERRLCEGLELLAMGTHSVVPGFAH